MKVIIASLVALLVSTLNTFAIFCSCPGDATVSTSAVCNCATAVPTLSEWGMIGMVCALGVIGAIALRKRLTIKAGWINSNSYFQGEQY